MGKTPLSINEHATQLRTQAVKLLEAAGENKKAFQYQATAPFIQNTIELCNSLQTADAGQTQSHDAHAN